MSNIEVVVGYAVNVPQPGSKAGSALPSTASEQQETVWVSPFDVRFSQNVIYPKFSDGRHVDEAVKQTGVLEPSEDESEAELILEPPFPAIQVVSWSPKLRDGEGKPLLDSQGAERRGGEALFTLDNRRLYALQRAAVARHPQRCRVAVSVIISSADRARHVKKFRTRMNGLSITVSEWNGVGRDNARDFSAMRVWDWRSVVDRADEADQLTEADAETRRALVEKAADSGNCGSWEYLDNKDVCRGPFSNAMMRQWWERRMLPGSLRIRPYSTTATAAEKGTADSAEVVAQFRHVAEVFEDAPAPFAPGWSPRTTDHEAEWNTCTQCQRSRWEGWANRSGDWYCAACWKRWSS